ncbi:hypothetical protein EDD66_11193 [Mobilisporobacter senegalensis]|uniref:Uncharacterized protein n=1 Tax=Mobilisporobacter senegalensis TaxID=1329262 RepID=A0A3N1XGU1_9FIRM|nr:hypothetical protein [Mobilisporobacter senegalensis]ROR25331.1 hypothetical protein EDD66_11193 [Mobilisporobacter senegalensis]
MSTDKTDHTIKVKKKRKKTKIILGILLVFIIYNLYKIISPFYIIPSEIKELNEHINLTYKFATSIEEYNLDEKEWKNSEGYGVSFMRGEDEYFGFEGFPDLSSSLKFTSFWSTDSDTSIFGGKIGDDLDDLEKSLYKYGYEQVERTSGDVVYNKGRIKIIIDVESIHSGDDTKETVEETIQGISIYLKSTDWLHKGYYK